MKSLYNKPNVIGSHLHNVISQERDCKGFVEWQQGFTPKEHREMLDRKWQMEFEESVRKSNRKWRIIELVIALSVGAVIALVAAMIQRGILLGQ
jgi:hypothetical protein